MRYVPNTEADRREMLSELGFESIEDLFANLPEEMRLRSEEHTSELQSR